MPCKIFYYVILFLSKYCTNLKDLIPKSFYKVLVTKSLFTKSLFTKSCSTNKFDLCKNDIRIKDIVLALLFVAEISQEYFSFLFHVLSILFSLSLLAITYFKQNCTIAKLFCSLPISFLYSCHGDLTFRDGIHH